MARTKKQVLQATARKQQLLLEAEQRAARQAEQAGQNPARKGRPVKPETSTASSSGPGITKHVDPQVRPPGRPIKTPSPRKVKPLLEQLSGKETEDVKGNTDGSLYKKIILAPQKKNKVSEDVQAKEETADKSNALDKKNMKEEYLDPPVMVNLDAENDSYISTPISGPVNMKKTKFTARKSTNALKKAEAQELLQSLARKETGAQPNPTLDIPSAHLVQMSPEAVGRPSQLNPSQKAFPLHKLYERKSGPYVPAYPKLKARKSIRSPSKGSAKKSFLTARKSFPPCTLAPEEVELYRDNDQPSTSSTPDVESVSVFPSIHEAVITLPKSQTLPVALVCIKDIYKGPDPAEGNEGQTMKETPPHSIRRSNSNQSTKRSNERPKSPRRKSPKGDRKAKNIFEQFQNEIKEKGSRSKKMSPNKKSAGQEVASTAISSAMKVLRSVSEKVDGQKRKSEKSGLSPRKKSPRRNSLKGDSPEKSDAEPRRKSNSPARSPRSGKKTKDVPEKRRSASASPRGERRIRSPSVKLQDDNVVYMPLVKKGKVSSRTSPNEFMLTLKGQLCEETNKAKVSECKSGAIRQLDFVERCKEQIVKNIAEADDTPVISGSSPAAVNALPITSSSPKPSTSTTDGPSGNSVTEDVGVRSKGLLDLITKVDNRIKTALFVPLESTQCVEEEECSDVSSLNTSHNSDTLSHLVDQMEAETSSSVPQGVDSKTQSDKKSDVENDTVPPDVKCGELYRRLTGKVADPILLSSSQRQTQSSPVKPPPESVKDVVKDNILVLDKSEGCLLKKHLLSPVKSVIEDVCVKHEQAVEKQSVPCDPAPDPVPPESSDKGSKSEETVEGKRIPLWRKLYRTKEPLPLEILAKAEKDCNLNKKSAFVSDELENYLEDVKKLNLKCDESLDREEHNASPESVDYSLEVKDIEPDFDEVEGVLFVSFASKDIMDAHIAVEKKNHWDKDANHLLGVSRLLSFEKEKQEGDSPEQGKAKTPSSLNLRGQHMKWKKYKRMLKEEFDNLQMTRERGDPYSGFRHPEKTSDITKIKGWRNKFVDMEGDAGKLHWRTEERLLRNLEPDDIKALGIKKKRRKNIVFTHRKGTSKDIGYPSGRTSIYGQSGSPEEVGDNWDMMMEEYEEPLYGDYGEGSDHTDEEMRRINWSYGHSEEGVSVIEMDSGVRDRPFGHAKRTQVRNEFADLFSWGEEEMKIMKNLGGRVRNRRKKNDPTDMTSLLRDSESPEMRKKFRLKMKVKRSEYIPVAVITEQMAIDATCALDFGIYKPSKTGTRYADNINTKTRVLQTGQPNSHAGMKLHNKGSTFFRAQRDPKRPMLKSGVPTEYVRRVNSEGDITADASLDNDSRDEDGIVTDGSRDPKRPCDKPGCRYGCICHLCNDNQEDLEPRCQESHTCNKEYCRLGCICDSLVSNQEANIPFHCGKPECMIECMCSRPERRSPSGAASSGLPDDGANSSDEIPPLIQDSDVSAEGAKFDREKAKEDKPAVSKTWSRHPRVDKYSNLPKRESRHRMSKNLDAITRKALMVYETSEVYCEQSGRSRKKHTEEVSPGSRAAVSKLTSPTSKAKGPLLPKVMKRKPSISQEVVQISDDDDDNTDLMSCARSAAFTSTKASDRDLSNDPTVVRIEKTESESGASSISVTPGGSRPGSPGPNPQDLGRRLAKVAIDCQSKDGAALNSDKPKPQAPEVSKRKPSKVLPADQHHLQWHTQMVCLKANPKPKDANSSELEPEEIKLLEFMANCNWDNAKPQILSRVAQCLSRGVYPDPRRMVIGDFIVEIMPKADKCAVIPPELKGKLPEHMYSIRVKVMRKASESDIKKFLASSAHLKHRASLNKPRDSVSGQSCDSASKRVFNNTSYGALDKSRALSQPYQKHLAPTPSSSAPPSAPTSSAASSVSQSPMGISGFNRLQISRPCSTFMESSGNSNMTIDGNRSEMVKLNDLSGNRDAESDSPDIEHITVQNTETGDSISMVVGSTGSKKKKKSEKEAKLSGNEHMKKKNKSKLRSAAGDVVHESKPKILKATTTSSLDKLGKIPLSGPVDEKYASIFGCVEDSPGGADSVGNGEMTIDLTDDNVETNQNETHNEPEQHAGDPKSVKPPDNGRNESSSIKMFPSSMDMKHPSSSTPKLVPPVQNQTFQIRGPAAPPIGQILVPVSGPTMQTAGSQIILAGAPVATNVSSNGQPRPTKTIISTPGGKLYGPFTDINDVKMLQVKNPDGTTQPLLRFLPANSFPIVQPTKPVASQGNKIQKSLLGTKYIPGPHGTLLRLEEVVENKSQEKTKVIIEEDPKPPKKKKRKKNVDPASANGLNADESVGREVMKKGQKSVQSNSIESFDEVDGSSGWKVRKGGSKGQLMAPGQCPVGKDTEKKTCSETHLVTSLDEDDPGTAQQHVNQVNVIRNTADKENKGQYCETASGTYKKHGDGDKDSSQKKVARKPGQSTSSGAVEGGPRHARSLSLDSPDTIKTSTPNPGAYKVKKMQQGFLPVKRQRSDSDSAAFADASKRIKLVDGRPSSDALGSPSQILANIESSMMLTPIQKFKERMNLPVIDISDDDSQMSFDGCSSFGHALQGHGTINISEEEEMDVLGGPEPRHREDARETLYRRLKEDEEDLRGEVRERKTHKERARRQDILCMFMYLYNSISDGEENPTVTLSRQKVLDAALMTIECEKQRSAQLIEDLKMEKFYRRAQKRRLRVAVDGLLKKGVPAKVIGSHLEGVKQQELKRHSKRHLLRKIIQYGKQKSMDEEEVESEKGTSAASPSTASASIMFPSVSQSNEARTCEVKETNMNSIGEKFRAAPGIKVDPKNPSQFWSENEKFVIEIEKNEDEETVNEDIEKKETTEDKLPETVDKETDVKSKSGKVEGEQEITVDEECGENSGKTPSMQNSPVRKEKGDIKLREKGSGISGNGTLQRSNSEEAILQVESFIENAVRLSFDRDEGIVTNEMSVDNSDPKVEPRLPITEKSEQINRLPEVVNPPVSTTEENQPVECLADDVCVETPDREKSPDKEAMFGLLLPSELNFDDASVESVPMESKAPNSSSEATGDLNNIGAMSEISQSDSTQGSDKMDTSSVQENGKSGKKENFLICDVRGLAKNEFFCPK